MKRTPAGFSNYAAQKIWDDHLGNNAYVVHRDQCETCTASYKARSAGDHGAKPCAAGLAILDVVLVEVFDKIDEVSHNGN